MKLQLHHIEMCVTNLNKTLKILRDQFGFKVMGYRKTKVCEQIVVQSGRTIFLINSRRELTKDYNGNQNVEELALFSSEENEVWTSFCCNERKGKEHVDSVFNIAIEVEDLHSSLKRLKAMNCIILRDLTLVESQDGIVSFAIVKSCCGNVIHTLIQKSEFNGWFLPGFNRLMETNSTALSSSDCSDLNLPTHFDHVAIACKVGEANHIISWYEEAFGMRRFITNKQDTTEDGLVIDGEVGMRLKVMEFWKCSEIGVEPTEESNNTKEPLKIVVVESLANIRNTQIENFLEDHLGPGIQHIGLHTNNMTNTVEQLIKQGVKFRYPPATYYTEIGQLEAINSVGENVDLLKKYGILLDSEADVLEASQSSQDRYLMQIFTYPIFDRDTFFLEIIQRKGARGFGVGNVTALARSVNASNEQMLREKQKKDQQ